MGLPPRLGGERSTVPAPLAEFLAGCVARRASVLVSGGTGSGKTTTLGALSGAVPEAERIVTIEDAAELRLRQPHVVRLEARPANLEGRGEVTIRLDLDEQRPRALHRAGTSTGSASSGR